MNIQMRKPIYVILAMLIVAGFAITSCDDDDEPVKIDNTVLLDTIAAAKDLIADTEEGVNDDQFPAGSKAILQTAITAAQAVADNTASTQTQVNNAISSLHQVMDAYRAKVIKPIAEADLVGHWSFDEGTGTKAGDKTNHKFDGTFKTGPSAWGSGFPTWATDRHGDGNKAISFDDGANVEVPYNALLNPAKMTISVWVNPAEIRESNRFIGLQAWIGYKFQLQASNRAFFTITTKDNGIQEEDGTVELPLNEWHHLVVTFGDGKLTFYVDGVLSKEWDKPGEGKTISPTYNLVFGQDFPTDKYAATDANFENDHIIPLAWGGYYHGLLDEIRIYKTNLTAAQVTSLYDREKP
jgi:hypothetical protein